MSGGGGLMQSVRGEISNCCTETLEVSTGSC